MNTPAALLVIDLQNAIDHPRWRLHGDRNNHHAEAVIRQLLNLWRSRGLPIYHIRHDSTEPHSAYRPGQPGNDFKPETAPAPGETVVVKHTNSAFIGTGLAERLREAGHTTLFLTGVITNNSVEATARMAGNLGFATYLVEDGSYTFARPDWAGRVRTADEVHAMSLANLDGEYATVVSSAAVPGILDSAG